MSAITLNNGVTIPQIGYGVFQIPPADAQRMTEAALAVGYRHIDTAAGYQNEEGVGSGVISSGIPRDEIFVTTKLWNADQGYEKALAAYETSRKKLGLDYIDLYLIHFPVPQKRLYAETWKALEKLYAEGAVRAIGVSNFKFPYLDRLLAGADVIPAVHQIEVHPTYQQAELDALTRTHGIAVEAYSPLGRGADLTAPIIVEIAERVGASPAQVIMKWHLDRGRVVLPKSASVDRLTENLRVDAIELTESDLTAIETLEEGLRTGEDIETFDIPNR
ncbi:aldo/keto reductase [Subtercola sp. PAMC28395]|uniref:aldo/keto reductase n=1 Tax=Subtercola sp. PAMC28395 TaxID=2846775 RepID=UPI001C0B66D4|nr:aldo/keto reductase [Subtercola sp. PAMC28395]QWT22827.1 aldo/keto reductase [Subtercola sp. PAMC28395]